MKRGAIFSPCKKYRYMLWRCWDINLPSVMFIMLNPSTADGEKDDPTCRRVIGISKKLGFGQVYMLNLFAYITPYPGELIDQEDPIGEDNVRYLMSYAHTASTVIYAYGASEEARVRAIMMYNQLPDGMALMINKDGSPRHPLYVPNYVKLVPFKINNK